MRDHIMTITVIEHCEWRRDDGMQASVYGAVPWTSSAEKPRWTMVSRGWTWRDMKSGTVGLGRMPAPTKAEAEAVAAQINAHIHSSRVEHAKAWAPVNAPIIWTKSKNNAGETLHHSGEGWSIRKAGDWFQVENAEGDDNFPSFRTIKKARDWAERMIRSDRQKKAFG